jgi:tetratricopeptide (TPR) repeat protein
LNRVALRDDAPALALRGIAMAQLGDLDRAKALLRSAARAFGPKEAVARARCVLAEAEIALVSRDLGSLAKALDAARATLEQYGDRVNAAHARHLEVRRLLLIGRLDEAERRLGELDPAPFPPASKAAHELVIAGIAMRRLRVATARAALARALRAARRSYPCPDGRGRKRISRAEHAGGAPDCAWRGAPPPARGRRSVTGVERARRRRVPSCRA